MLTDVFFRRYANRPMFTTVGQKESALFVQAYRIVNEQIWSYYGYDKKIDESVKAIWSSIHDQLSMEIGVKELSLKYFSYQAEWLGKPYTNSGWNEMNFVVEQWLNAKFTENMDADMFVKRRLSFIELAFRTREKQVALENQKFPRQLAQAEMQDKMPQKPMTILGRRSDGVRAMNESINKAFAANVQELNERFKQAGMPLHYHSGFIQITQDELLQLQVEQPFWLLVKDAQWKNVSIDMVEAIDRRDTAGRDPSFYAAKALESTIKIICEIKKLTTGKEKGVSDFLNHLERKANGAFIEDWERQSIQRFIATYGTTWGTAQAPKTCRISLLSRSINPSSFVCRGSRA
jgi:hypothetical protein